MSATEVDARRHATAQDVVEVDELATAVDSARADALAAYIGESCGRPTLADAR